jgi:predicted transcriptional regulator
VEILVESGHKMEFHKQSKIGWGNRGWVEIAEAIISTCTEGSLKTHIMHQVNLNYNQVNQYLDYLVKHDLLEIERYPDKSSKRPKYITTRIGFKYLSVYGKLKKILK